MSSKPIWAAVTFTPKLPPMLRIDCLEVFYDEVQALKSVSLEVNKGEIVTSHRSERCRENDNAEDNFRLDKAGRRANLL